MPKSYKIKQDGTEYTFTPGKNGSLTAPYKPSGVSMASMIDKPYVKRAKVIVSPEIKKSRMNLFKSMTGSVRG